MSFALRELLLLTEEALGSARSNDVESLFGLYFFIRLNIISTELVLLSVKSIKTKAFFSDF